MMGAFGLLGLVGLCEVESSYLGSTMASYSFNKLKYLSFSPSSVRLMVFMSIWRRDFFVLYMKFKCSAVLILLSAKLGLVLGLGRLAERGFAFGSDSSKFYESF